MSFHSKAESEAADAKKTITIDGNTIREGEQSLFRGLGAVSCNSSSRLLMDYKEQNEEKYWEIMNWLFHPTKGAGLSHIKLELGCDSDTSSGSEPATKRSQEEVANVNRGAGYMFAHDALTINPDITLDMLCWGMPAWVEQAYEKSNKDGYKARYQWYKETIDAAYDVWGLQFSYVSANKNEREIEKAWTKYLANALENETEERYDYGDIKIVSADETDNMYVAEEMLKDEEFRDAVDVIGCHYNSYMDKNVLKLQKQYGKEVWYSEGSSVATDSVYGANNTQNAVATSGENGMLDIANRIINGIAESNMTLYEFQPAVAAYYDGTVYYPKQLISATKPWSGYYENSNGLAMVMHFTNFIEKGWGIVESGSYGDGEQINHCIFDTNDNYVTAMDTTSGDYSTVITNDSSKERVYQVEVSNTKKADTSVAVWETKTAEEGEVFDADWLRQIDTIVPQKNGDNSIYEITVKPYSMVTLTTTRGQFDYQSKKVGTGVNDSQNDTVLALPYTEDYEYEEEFLERRGGTPLYTHDLDGAFEVVKMKNGNQVLQQKINTDIRTSGWTSSSEKPQTSFGDDTWRDYTVSVDVMLDENEKGNNYVSLAARYNASARAAGQGYWLRLYRSGQWKLLYQGMTLAKGSIKGMKEGRFVNLKLTVLKNTITGYINGEQIVEKVIDSYPVNSGRVALESNFYNNCFDNIKVMPVYGGVESVTRIDNMDSAFSYSKGVELLQSQSYLNYGRTISVLSAKSQKMTGHFKGSSIALLGYCEENAKIKVTIDGEVKEKGLKLKDTIVRTAFYQIDGLEDKEHDIEVQLLNNAAIEFDAAETANSIFSEESVPVTAITMKQSIEMKYGECVSLETEVTPQQAEESIMYTTSDMSVVQVLGDGTVYANGAGQATVTATAPNGETAKTQVTVSQVVITPGSGVRVGAGEKVSLKASYLNGIMNAEADGIVWTSANEEIAQVSQSGVVTTKKAGYASITATAADGTEGTVIIHVRKAPYQIKAKKSLKLKKGKKKQLKYTLPSDCAATKVTFKSSKAGIAKVSKTGMLTAKKKGNCKITITTYNGKKAVIKVTVK